MAARDKKTEARNKWLYHQVKKGNKTYRQIMLALAKKVQVNGWRKIVSPQGIEQAVNRYVERNGLDPLPPRIES